MRRGKGGMRRNGGGMETRCSKAMADGEVGSWDEGRLALRGGPRPSVASTASMSQDGRRSGASLECHAGV
eukprot:8793362-Pyramimonas_sp.AAC.1